MNDWDLHSVFALGGGLGAVLRHLLARVVTHQLPLSTLIVNVLGCLLLGVWISSLGYPTEQATEHERRLVFGFCGGFTTFSTFAYQSLQLHRERTIASAAVNILLSFVLCMAAFWLGLAAYG